MKIFSIQQGMGQLWTKTDRFYENSQTNYKYASLILCKQIHSWVNIDFLTEAKCMK